MGLFDCDCVCAQPPDYSGVARANEEAAKYAYKAANEDLAFRKKVYEESRPQIEQLRDLAAQVAQQQLGIAGQNQQQAQAQWQQYLGTFQPQERLMAADALAAQYLSDADRERLLALLQPVEGLTPAQRQAREQEIYALTKKGEKAMEDTIKAQAAGLEGAMRTRADELYAREQQRAMDDELRARLANEAAINSSYGMQARDLSRHGFNANRIAQAAARLAQQQALARVQANNQMYGLTAQRLRGAEDMANAIRYQGEDTARQMRNQAKETAGNKYASLRAGAAAFGRNMPNTAGQAYGLATGAGTQAVGNQNVGLQSGLPYAQFVAQGTGNQLAAAGIQQQGALGLGNLLSRDYATAQSAYNNMGGGSGLGDLGTLIGSATQAYMAFASDRRLKKNISELFTDENGITWYSFEFIDPEKYGEGTRIGVMADEVEKIIPEAVFVGADGYKMVDYSKLRAQ